MPTPSPFRGRGAEVLALLIGPAVLAGLGAWGLARDGAYGNDEAATRWASLLPLHALFHLLGHLDAVHALYYLGMHVWVVFGSGPVALRLPSLLAAAATSGVVTALGRRLSGSTIVGVIAGLLYAISPFVMFYAQTARSYAIVSLVVAITTTVFVRALDAEREDAARSVVVRRWIAYAVLVALAGWLNEIALLAVGAHAVTLLVTGYPWRARWHWLTAAVLGGAAVLPLFKISYGEKSHVAAGHVSVQAIHHLFGSFFGPYPSALVVTIGCAVVALLPTAHARAALADHPPLEVWRDRGPVGVASVALPLLLIPPTLLIVESAISTPLFISRYLLYCVTGAVLLVAHGAHRISCKLLASREPAWIWVPGIALVIFVLVVQLSDAQRIRTPGSRERDFGAPAAYVGANARPGDGVLFFTSFFRMVELGYPADFRVARDVAVGQTPLASGTFRGINAPFAIAAPRILACDRIWVVGDRPRDPSLGPLYVQERDLLFRNFVPLGPREFRGVDVTLWARRTQPHGSTT
jgi:mannosyltransferase